MLTVWHKLSNGMCREQILRISTSLGTPWPYQQIVHSLSYLATQISIAARSAQSGQFWSLQGSAGTGGPQPKNGNGGRGDVFVAPFAGEFVEKDSPPSSNVERTGPSSCERISLPPAPLPRASRPEGAYMNAGRCCSCLLSDLTYMVRTYICMYV